MFTRDEASRIRQEFWTTFGKYMNPVPSAEGTKVNWVNYHTTIKDVYFRMNADRDSAIIAISLEHNDLNLQRLFFEKFSEFKSLLHSEVEETWKWQQHFSLEGKVISRIYQELPGVSVLKKEQWPDLISFFKPRMIALDRFWENARYSFESLQ